MGTSTEPDPHTVTDGAALAALFGPVGAPSLRKEADHLHPVYAQWLAQSPFCVLATRGAGGLDASPRGDPAPLVQVLDERTLLLPERRGNNRIDSLQNILHDPHVALLFLIPGIGETLRVNGCARITTDPALLAPCAQQGKVPVCGIVVAIDSVFFQCARALQRSALWAGAAPPEVPSAGAMLAALTAGAEGGPAYDQVLPERQRSTLY